MILLILWCISDLQPVESQHYWTHHCHSSTFNCHFIVGGLLKSACIWQTQSHMKMREHFTYVDTNAQANCDSILEEVESIQQTEPIEMAHAIFWAHIFEQVMVSKMTTPTSAATILLWIALMAIGSLMLKRKVCRPHDKHILLEITLQFVRH